MSIEESRNIEDTPEFAEAVNRHWAEVRRRTEAEKDEMAAIRKEFEAKPPEEQKAIKERVKNLWRVYEIMSGRQYDVFSRDARGYRDLFEDPLFRNLPEAKDLLEQEKQLLESGVSKPEIDKYSGFYGKIHRLQDDIRSELIYSPSKLGTYQQHERRDALDEIRREREALEDKEN